MKKIAVVFITLFIASLNINAQLPVNLGFKIGINSSKMPTEYDNINDIKDQAKTGILAGAFARLNLPIFYVQPEIYYTKKGGNFQSSSVPAYTNQLYTQQTVFNTIDIPLLLGVKLINLNVVNIRLMAGPVLSFIISKNISSQLNGVDLGSNSSFNPHYKDKIWAIQAGAGIDVWKFTVDFRFEWGLNNISNDAYSNIKSNLMNFSVGMKLF
jgi:hypothetical protein